VWEAVRARGRQRTEEKAGPATLRRKASGQEAGRYETILLAHVKPGRYETVLGPVRLEAAQRGQAEVEAGGIYGGVVALRGDVSANDGKIAEVAAERGGLGSG